MFWNILATLIGIAGLVLLYGTSGEQGRANFRSWAGAHIERVKPYVSQATLRGLFFILLIVAGLITWTSINGIYGFLVSSEPLTRKDVFTLLLNIFNTFAYGSASLACLMLTFAPHPKKKLPLELTEGKPVTFTLQGEPDSASFKEALKKGISVTISIDSNRQLHVEPRNIEGLSLSRS